MMPSGVEGLLHVKLVHFVKQEGTTGTKVHSPYLVLLASFLCGQLISVLTCTWKSVI